MVQRSVLSAGGAGLHFHFDHEAACGAGCVRRRAPGGDLLLHREEGRGVGDIREDSG